ncbi:MAG: twin-arginine translocase subunit TatC [Actinomycetes bacterium]
MDSTFQRASRGMTLAQHLAEARRRILFSFLAIVIFGILAFVEYNAILTFLEKPYCDLHLAETCQLTAIGALSAFSIRIKIAYYCGLLFASPVVLWQIWRFITPGLKKRERRYALSFLIAATIFFAGGCSMAFLMFNHALQFLNAIGGAGIATLYTADSYIGLIILMMFVFGLTFEFPVILVGLQLGRVVTSRQLLKFWRYAIILITTASAVFTPSGDPLSMMAMMIPLLAFYFLAIGVGKLAKR